MSAERLEQNIAVLRCADWRAAISGRTVQAGFAGSQTEDRTPVSRRHSPPGPHSRETRQKFENKVITPESNLMSRNYELMRKAGDAIHAHRDPDPYMQSLPLDVPVAEMATRGEPAGNPDASILDLLQAVFRRRAWIYFWTITMLAAAGLVCLLMTPQYKAESKLEILKQDTSGLSLNNGGATDASLDPLDFNMTLQTQMAVLKSDVLAWRVMRELKLVDARHVSSRSAAAAAEPTQLNEITPDKEADRALKKFKSNLKVSAISGTRLIAVSYLHPDPNTAAKIVNQLMADLIEYNFQVRHNATIKATDWLQQELVDLRSQLEKSQQRAAQLQKESGIFGQDEKNN